jgi:hypothetical protein
VTSARSSREKGIGEAEAGDSMAQIADVVTSNTRANKSLAFTLKDAPQ